MRRSHSSSSHRAPKKSPKRTLTSLPNGNKELVLQPNNSQYKPVELLNEGAYGKVYKVIAPDGKVFAQKVYTRLPDANEIDILTRFVHPNLLHAVEVFFDGKMLNVILPYAHTDLLNDLNKNSSYSFAKALQFSYDILSALHFMNASGYFHCDLKHENVMIDDTGKFILVDFGLSFLSEIQHPTTICGTDTYGSPQIMFNMIPKTSSKWGRIPHEIRDEIPNRFQSDIYAFGVMLYECLIEDKLIDTDSQDRSEKMYQQLAAGHVRAERKIESAIAQSVDANVQKLLKVALKCCALSQKNRYKTVIEILQEPVFANRGLSQPIPGRVTNVDFRAVKYDTFARNPEIPYKESMRNMLISMIYICGKLLPLRPLQVLPQAFQLMYRFSPFIKRKSELVLYGLAAIWIAQNVLNGTRTFGLKEMSSIASEATLTYVINKCIGAMGGVIWTESINEVSDNAVAVCWYLAQVVNDINYIRRPPRFVLDDFSKQFGTETVIRVGDVRGVECPPDRIFMKLYDSNKKKLMEIEV